MNTPILVPDYMACDRLAWVLARQGHPLETICRAVERSAIYESEAGMTREQAEAKALRDAGVIR